MQQDVTLPTCDDVWNDLVDMEPAS